MTKINTGFIAHKALIVQTPLKSLENPWGNRSCHPGYKHLKTISLCHGVFTCRYFPVTPMLPGDEGRTQGADDLGLFGDVDL